MIYFLTPEKQRMSAQNLDDVNGTAHLEFSNVEMVKIMHELVSHGLYVYKVTLDDKNNFTKVCYLSNNYVPLLEINSNGTFSVFYGTMVDTFTWVILKHLEH